MTTVACHNTNPNGRRVFYTGRGGNVRHETKTIVTTIPAPVGLSGLAQFLAEHVPNTSNHRGALTVNCYDDTRTEGDVLRTEGRRDAEKIIRAYDLDSRPAAFGDWLFPIIGDAESSESFWNRAADGMIAAGVTRVVVRHPFAGAAEYRV